LNSGVLEKVNADMPIGKVSKDINERLLVWLLREGKGMGPTLRYLKHLEKLGATHESLRMLTMALKRSMRIEEELVKILTDSKCNLLKKIDATTPTKDMKVDPHGIKIYETVEASVWTLNIIKFLQAEKKSFDNIDALIQAMIEKREAAHDKIMEFFGDIDCILMNAVDNVTSAALNELLQAGETQDKTLEALTTLNENQRTFFQVADLVEAVRSKTGVKVLTL